MMEQHRNELVTRERAGSTEYATLLTRKRHICQRCGRGFRSEASLEKHALAHTKENIFSC
ncbi:zinc finger, C2H2 type, partial [Opisthorchis viverrini]